MTITIVTDHRFYRSGDDVFDDYVFDYDFFKTYLAVFDTVKVVARVKNVDTVQKSWVSSSGPHVDFIDIEDIHGIRWLFLSKKFFKNQKSKILDTDCFCFRIPASAAWEVFKLNKNRKPYMFEAIGDPEDAMIPSKSSFIQKTPYRILGKYLKYRNRRITKNAKTGSYVSLEHLQIKYPVKKGVFTESISSIRLPEANIIERKDNLTKEIKIVHVGSFIPLKNQTDLIYLAKLLKDGDCDCTLHFVGDGILKRHCEELTRTLSLEKEVTFHGQVTGAHKIFEILDNANVFILPSSNEGMPRALIEAMARGLICFGSNTGGTSELLPKEFTFSPGDINYLYQLLLNRFINLPVQLLKKISSTNISVARGFSQEVLNEKRVIVLENLKQFVSNE